MKSVFTVTEADLYDALIDTRYDLHVTDITDAARAEEYLEKLYGRHIAVAGGEAFAEGSASLFKPRYSDGDLIHVMRALTGEGGCPWDRAQTHGSIRKNAIEEAYELCDAIDAGDVGGMREETGDILLQALFHCDIAERAGEFTRLDVVDELVRKLVTRHTHIFGEDRADDEAQALERWEAAKAKEKHAETLESKLARIPDTFPALLKLQKTLKKLVEAGLVNDAEERSARDLLICACGALKSGADIEPDLIREVNALAVAFTSGKIAKVSELK